MRLVLVTGWEPHHVVSWSQACRERTGLSPACTVFGREPITSTEVFLDGVIVEERHDKYDRGYTLSDADGRLYKVGGTNTTSSIATNFALLRLPDDVIPPPATWDEILDSLVRTPLRDSLAVMQAEHSARLSLVASSLRRSYIYHSDSRRYVERILARLQGSEVAATLPDIVEWRGLIQSVAGRIDAETPPDVLQRLAYLAALIPDAESAQLLVRLASDASLDVRRAAALSLRSLEPFVQEEAATRPEALASVIEAARDHLNDADASLRVYSAEALGYFGNYSDDVLLDLQRLLTEDEDGHVRWACAVSLGRRRKIYEVARPLLRAAEVDSFIRVKRASLLSLGRVLGKARNDPVSLDMARLSLTGMRQFFSGLLRDPDDGVAGYAAYCLGEMSQAPTDDVVDGLIECMDTSHSFSLRCNALLALSKLPPEVVSIDGRLEVLERHLRDNLSAQASSEHPGSAYREWFLQRGWRLLTHLARPRLAALYARVAADTFVRYPKRSRYHEALAQCELAEAELSEGQLQRAVDRLRDASRTLSELRDIESEPGDLSPRAVDSSAVRLLLVHARLSVLQGLIVLRLLGTGLADAETHLSLAERLYRQVLEGRPAEPTRSSVVEGELSDPGAHADYQLVALHLQVVRCIRAAGRIMGDILGNETQAGDVASSLGVLDAAVNALWREIRGRSHVRPTTELDSELSSIRNDLERGWSAANKPLVAVAAESANRVLEILSQPLPFPDLDYRLLGAGRARFTLRIEGRSRGSGTADSPYTLLADRAFVVRAVVSVMLRADNELLVLRQEGAEPGRTGEWEIHAHEGSEIIELREDARGAPGQRQDLKFSLAFVYRGITEVVDQEELHIVWSDEAAESDSDLDEEAREQIALHSRQVMALEAEIAALRAGSARSGRDTLIADAERAIRAHRSEISRLSGLSD